MKRLLYLFAIVFVFSIFVSCNPNKVNNKVVYVSYTFIDDIQDKVNSLLSTRGCHSDTTIIGNYIFGMSPEELTKYLQVNNISQAFLPNKYTSSNIMLGDKLYNCFVLYGFDTNDRLRYVDIFLESTDEHSVRNDMAKSLGNHYIFATDKISQTSLWFCGNQEYIMYHSILCENIRIFISDITYTGDISTYEIDPIEHINASYLSLGKDSISVSFYSQYIRSQYSCIACDTLTYNGVSYTLKDGKNNKQMNKDEALEFFHSDKTYHLNTRDNVYVLSSPNGKRIVNPTGVLDKYYNMSFADEVYVLAIKGDWVKIQNCEYPQNCGWVRKNLLNKEPSLQPDKKIFNTHRYSQHLSYINENTWKKTEENNSINDLNATGLLEDIQSKKDAYNASIAREIMYKEAGLNDMAKQEKKERQQKLRSGEYILN